MTTSSLPLALPGSQVARQRHEVLAPVVGLLVVLAAAARTALYAFGRGVVSLAAAVVCGPRKRP